jgi:hypothetical protein
VHGSSIRIRDHVLLDNTIMTTIASPVVWVRLGSQRACCEIAAGAQALQRDDRIVCRTQRGLEIGTVLGTCQGDAVAAGRWLRFASAGDELLWDNLVQLSGVAAVSCQTHIDTLGTGDILLDVEPLLDGKTLFFHFLGEPSARTSEALERLIDIYANSVATSRFAKALEEGCGPGCGTSAKSGCGTSGGCSTCSVAGRCTA